MLRCKTHSQPGDVDLVNKLCIQEGCSTQACFGDPNDGLLIYCVKHKLEGHFDLKNKKCEHEDCFTQPNFGSDADDLMRWCKGHSQPSNTIQQKQGCISSRSWGSSEEDGVALRCAEHKLMGDESRRTLRARKREELKLM